MSSSTMRSDCRKFAPNIFNKSKCTNCFRQKEEHSAEALESNRATRKVAKCGYLFVAPGWDFSNPLNRTKRWQRRWFVLYDDGELSYSVDEHPETVPQASIDMNKVVEVGDAEDVTGNAYSLAVTAPDRVHFVKATCREEYRWWLDVLSVFPRSKGRHKRNATFSGVQPISITPQPGLVRAATPSDSRSRFHSCSSEPRKPPQPWAPEQDAVPTRDVTPPVEKKLEALYRDQPVSSTSPPTRDKIQTEDKSRTRRVANRERRGVKTGRSFSEDFTGILPSWRDRKSSAMETPIETSLNIFDEYDESRREEKLKDIADSLTRPRYRRHTQTRAGAYTVRPTRDVDCVDEERKGFGRPASPANLRGSDLVDSGDKPVRGDPDGCGLDINTQRYSPSSERRVDLPSEDLLNIKKGWLMKQAPNQEWVKHWFVLRGAALMYYRDLAAEDKGILDGVIDLSNVSSVAEVMVARNYGFQMLLWDERRYVLSAVTASIRSNWMAAIRKEAGLKEPPPPDSPIGSISEKKERDLVSSQLSVHCPEREPSVVSSTPMTPRSIIFSSDEEYRTASEGGRRESQDWGEPLAPLPPSPPLNRTPISRVKEKARSRTNKQTQGVYKRSRSSPPSSRRSTLDSVVPEDLILASCGELPESEADDSLGVDSNKSSLITVDGTPAEIADLKLQLNVALREVSEAEQERLKLRHYRSEVLTLENQVKELLDTLEQIQVQLTLKTKEAEEVEGLRKRYNDLLREHEGVLSQWRQQTMEDDWKELYKQIQERYRLDSEKWQLKLGDSDTSLQEMSSRYEALTRDLGLERDTIQRLHSEVISLSERLAQGIEENESLYRRVRELEGRGGRNSLSISRERGRSVDSLSDLTNIDLDLNLDEMDKERITEEYEELRGRFEKAVQEIRAMKRELRESHAMFDDLELSCISLRQDARSNEHSHTAQTELMVARIDDLTLKLSAAEKQVRTLKQKMAKSDSREKRRSLSLKGRESFQIGKELEEKLGELELKINALETGVSAPSSEKPKSPKASRSNSPKTEEKEKKNKESLKISRLRRKSLDSATSSEPMKVLIRLSSLESKVAKAAEKAKAGNAADCGKTLSPKALPRSKKNLQPVEVNIDRASEEREAGEDLLMLETNVVEEIQHSVHSAVAKLESLLRTKLTELAEQRRSLRESGCLTEEASTRLLAEKLAYESVLVSRIAQAVESSEESSEAFRKFVIEGEILESSRLISSLKSKLCGNGPESIPSETATDHLTRILSERLLWHKQLALSVNTSESTSKPHCAKIVCPEQIQCVLQLQNELDVYVQKYRKTKLDQLANALALETLSLTDDCEDQEGGRESRSTLEDHRIREAWTMAQETVNRELIQAEISHVMMRCGQNYETSLASDQKDNFSLLGTQRMILEQWCDTVDQNLQREMETGIEALTLKYECCLSKLKKTKSGPITCSEYDVQKSRRLLSEFADITAQKALIDARLSVICQDLPSFEQKKAIYKSNISLKHLLEGESNMSRLSSNESDHLAEADFQFLFKHFSQQCLASIIQDDISPQMISINEPTLRDINETIDSLSHVEEDLSRLQNFVGKVFSAHFEPFSIPAIDPNEPVSWKTVLTMCSSLCEHISIITDGLLQGMECERCIQLNEAMQNLSAEHEEELQRVRESQEIEMASLQADLEKQRHLLTSQHEEEQAQLMERARRLERRLGTLDSEYMQQVDNLRAAYHKTLSAGLERDVDGEENIRQRYQAEIEHLRTLCEKGLAAMESSHRRIVSELEEKHRQELEQARVEKDQALAEETQATLAALDAMRKAHEMEVQKEIIKFKTEFVRKMHSAQDISVLHKEQEAEMEEIKQEILSLSEKYSVKCVESASYEEQLSVANMKLADAEQQILQLDARNKQLRAHLASEASEIETADAAQLLRRKSRELEHKCDELGHLQKKLSLVSNHGEELSALCSRLRDEYLCADRGYADNPVLLAKLWDKVQQLANAWPLQTKGAKISTFSRSRPSGIAKDLSKSRQFPQEPATPANAVSELSRGPRSSVSRSSSPFSSAPLRPLSPSPLSGMVAERKKIFEP